MKNEIIEGSASLFMQYGVRSVTMDDIASHLSISKKTLYQHFKDKNEIVTETTKTIIEKDKDEFIYIQKNARNAVEELFQVSHCLRRIVSEINPSLLFDLKKYHNNAWKVYMDYKEKFIFNMIVENLKRGIKEKYFRKEINPYILARFRTEQVQLSFDNKIFPRTKFDFKEVQLQLFDHFLYGIMTQSGKKLYESYHENLKEHETQ